MYQNVTHLQIEAEEAIAILTDLTNRLWDEDLHSSAMVCLGDAEDLLGTGAFAHAVRRAHKGISYLTPFHTYEGVR